MSQDIAGLLTSGAFSDVTLRVRTDLNQKEGEGSFAEVKAHRIILCQTPFFEKAFAAHPHAEVVDIADVDLPTLQLVLKYHYGHEMRFDSPAAILNLVTLSDRFGLGDFVRRWKRHKILAPGNQSLSRFLFSLLPLSISLSLPL